MAEPTKSRVRSLECLEAKQLLAADVVLAPSCGCLPTAQVAEASAPDASVAAINDYTQPVRLQLPDGLPQRLSTTVEYGDQTLTLELDKNSVFGDNTRFLVDDGSGTLFEIDRGLDRSYIGSVRGRPTYSVNAVLTDNGLLASITRAGEGRLVVEPAPEFGEGMHQVTLSEAGGGHDHDGDGIPDHAPEDHHKSTGGGHPPGCSCIGCCGESDQATARSAGPITVLAPPDSSRSSESGETPAGAATQAPSRVMDVLEYEVGIEISSRAFLNNYGSDLSLAQSVAQGIAGNLDNRYLHATGVKHRVGTVIIRTNAATDPINVANGNDNAGLNAFRDYWNSNPGEVGTTHDLAVYHVQGSPSGLAYVNAVGTSNRYALTASNGPTSWADGTLVHEFGHTWSLPHANASESNLFYESKPRNFSGSNSAGGEEVFISPMDGRGAHNIGRFATDEANQIYAVREGKRQFGDLVTNPGPVKPFGHRDQAQAAGDPIVIDVIANDFDVNNDVLDVQLLDTVSQQGATISLSVGTGPGGRDEILYTPPSIISGTDFFHYTVVDSTGRSDWGAVYVTTSVIGIDTAQDFFSYDAGTTDSPVFSSATIDAVRLTPATSGDVSWTGSVQAVDRGEGAGNAYNRDNIFGTDPAVFSHKVENGRWSVVVNMSDPTLNLDNMYVDAEGQPGLTDLDRPIGLNTTVSFEVDVIDGELNLEFGDADTVNPRWAVNRINLQQVEAYVPPLLEGDFNRDGVVDAIDYSFYRDSLGESVATPYDGADADGDRTIGEGDRDIWAMNYGGALVSTPLITATVGNGEFAVDSVTEASSIGGGSEALQVILTRDRALRGTSGAGRGVAINGWEVTRDGYSGANPALGVDGLYGFATDAGTGPGQTGQVFVNSGSALVASDPITRSFRTGERLDLSYLLGSDNGATATVQSTVSFVFDEGLPTERTVTRPVQSATGLTTPEITEQLTVGAPATTLSIQFVIDGVQVGRRALLDQVTLDLVTSNIQASAVGTLTPTLVGEETQLLSLEPDADPLSAETAATRLQWHSRQRVSFRPAIRELRASDETFAVSSAADSRALLAYAGLAQWDDRDSGIAEDVASRTFDAEDQSRSVFEEELVAEHPDLGSL